MKEAQKTPQLRREILAIIFFTLSLVIFLSLVSYDPTDPSFSVYNINTQPIEIHNLLGIAGSYLSNLLFQVFGLGSFLLVLILLQFSFRLFLSQQHPLRLVNSLGWLSLIFSTAGILSLSLGVISLANFSGDAGGLLGYIISDFLTKYLSTIGSYIFLLLILILSIMASTHISFLRLGNLFSKNFFSLKKALNNLIKNIKKLIHKKSKKEALVTDSIIDKPLSLAVDTIEHKHPSSSGFKLPPLTLLQDPQKEVTPIEQEILMQNSRLLENKLSDFGVQAKVINVHPGPVVTLYELEPAPGVKIHQIVNLADDLALALRAIGIRIIAPIPGKAVIGVEIPNKNRETVYFKEIVAQKEFLKSDSPLTLGLGKDISGMPIITDLSQMPHLLIAGTTGSGKSVFINAVICSILYKALPSEVKLLIMDPKRSELTFYKDIPHLLYPIVTDAKQAAEALRWLVEEMERRYQLLSNMGTRDISSYNKKVVKSKIVTPMSDSAENGAQPLPPQQLPCIVTVIDELANLMMVSSREIEWLLARLAQMGRSAGIHLLLATQRPSVDIITGTIKANFPARISFRLASKTDSRIIIDTNGAENLLNQGDMLFLSPHIARLKRIHGPYISDDEIIRVVNFLKAQAKPQYQELRLESPQEESIESIEDTDEKYQEAVTLVTSLERASISLIQRKLRIGYNRAARIIEKMEEEGIVGPSDGVKPREVFRKMVDI